MKSDFDYYRVIQTKTTPGFREIGYFFKVSEMSGKFEIWSVKYENPEKSVEIQGKIISKVEKYTH
jgi:hypothetical protein